MAAERSICAWILEWLVGAPAEERNLVMMAWYELWLAWNNAREMKKIEEPIIIVRRVLNLLEEWRSVHAKDVQQPSQ